MVRLKWTSTGRGFQSGRYRIDRTPPKGWRLVVEGETAVEPPAVGPVTTLTAPIPIPEPDVFQSLKSAQIAATRLERDRVRQRTIRRHTTIFSAAVVVLLGISPAHSEPSPEYQRSVEFVEGLDAARAAVESGNIAVTDLTLEQHGMTGGRFDVRGAERSVITAEYRDGCYWITWEDGGPAGVGRLGGQDDGIGRYAFGPTECAPDEVAHWPAFSGWATLLPPAERTPIWFVLAVMALIVVALRSIVIVTTEMIRGHTSVPA